MRSTSFASLCLIFAAWLFSNNATALSLNSAHYAVYQGTAIYYGENYLFLVPKEGTLIINGRVATPIRFMPTVPAYRIRINLDGSLAEIIAQSDLNNRNLATECTRLLLTCTLSSTQLFNGDFDGDEQLDIALMHGGKIYALRDADGSNPSIYTSLTPPNGAQIASILDHNSDGRADIALTGNHGYLVSASAGQFKAESTPLFTNTSLVGAIAGNFRVNEQGAATYNIPIMTFAGTAGVSPQIALNYNSQSGSGIAGIGWSISGLSAVTRCRQTESQDGNAATLTFGAGDRFCLDGQRLILTSGSIYGAQESKYRTEIDSGAEVTAKGGSTGAPNYFEVTRKDGSISYYGNGGNSKQLAGSATLTWSINQSTDSAGNPIKFQYTSDNNSSFRIDRIYYAFGTNKTAATSNTYIEFTYSDRPDPQISYINASRLADTKRLTKIETFNNGISLRTYNLQYKTALPAHGSTDRFVAASRSYLDALYECIGSTCLKPTSFEWKAQSPGAPTNWGTKKELAIGNNSQVKSWKPIDFNGDGIIDFAAIVSDSSTSGGSARKAWVYIFQGLANGEYQRHTAYYQLWSTSDNTFFKMEIIDYNADGRSDIALWDRSSWKILLSKLTSDGWKVGSNGEYSATDADTQITTPWALFFDMDSNGVSDAFYDSPSYNGPIHRLLIKNANQPASSNLGYIFSSPTQNNTSAGIYHREYSETIYFDVNSDGLVDILTGFPVDTNDYSWAAMQTFDRTTNTFKSITDPKKYSWQLSGPIEEGLPDVSGDINADGAQDWLFRSSNYSNDYVEWRYVINNRHWGQQSGSVASIFSKLTPQLVDINRDGYLDVIWHDIPNQSLKIRYWMESAEGFGIEETLRPAVGSVDTTHLILDVNGDGNLEYLSGQKGKIEIHGGPITDAIQNVVVKINNGMGNQTEISYEQMSNRSNHYVGMDKRVTYEEEQKELCLWSTPCFSYTISSVNAAGYYTALNSDWNYDLADVYDGSGLSPTYIPKDPTGPILEFTAPIQIVTQVASSAPTGTNVNAKSRITYRYNEAKIQAKGRGLLGFRAITTVDEQSGIRTTTRYRQDFPFIGAPLLTEARTAGTTADPDGTLIKRSFNDYGYVQTNGTDNTKRYQVWTRFVTETSYDLNGAETSHILTQTAQPDAWGNITSTTVSTFQAGNRGSYLTRISTSNTYAGGIESVRYGRLSQSSVTHRRAGEPVVTRTSNFTYYTSGTATNLLNTETINAGSDGTPAVTTTYSYDNFGNKIRAVISATGEISRQTDWLYTIDGRYLESTINALGHITEQITMRNEYGSPTRIEGLNGYWSEIEYDDQGRETYRTDATGAWQRTTYSMSDLSAAPGAIYRITQEVAGGGSSTEYFDVLGRSIARAVIGFDGTPSWTRTDYDNFGRVKRQSEPYWNGQLEQWTVYEYDELGRLKMQTAPDNSVSGVTYNGLETLYINSLNQQRFERRNAAGELIEVQDHLGGKINNAYTTTGQLKSASVTADGKTVTTEMRYNSLGQKTRMFDPDKGTWFYEYTGFGELKHQYKVTSTVEYTNTLINLKSNSSQYQRTTMIYDQLGRMTQRSDNKQDNVLEGTATWAYDIANNGVGKLASESGGGLTRTYYYSPYGLANRINSVLSDYGGEAITFTATMHDNIGRPIRQLDALHFNSGTENIYNEYGYLHAIRDLETGANLYTTQATDARGNITRALLLGGETVERSYDAITGRLQVIKSSSITGNGDMQNLSYSWDTAGNMKSRNDLKYAQQQSFCYDALNRLIKSHNNLTGNCSLAPTDQDQQHDGFGNITRKTGVGAYTYSTDMKLRPHAVTKAGGTTYNYDNNGNLIKDGQDTDGDGIVNNINRTFTYTTFDLPTTITKGLQKVEFSYGADRSRWKRVDTDAFGTATTTWYLGNVEKIQMGSIVKYRRTIAGVAIFNYNHNQQITERLTLFTDALGSVVATRNVVSGVINGMAFNPWGERVMAGNYGDIVDGPQLTPFLSVLSVPTTRGFTGHEMVDSMGVVHMNGRIFDALLGRFLQADIQVDGVISTQGYNRYSYGQNNPLSGTDPSGYGFFKEIFDDFLGVSESPILNGIVQIAGCIVSGPYCGAFLAAYNGAYASTATYEYGGSYGKALLNGIIAGASAYAFTEIGGDWWQAGLIGGALGGVTTVMQGGNFGHGFVSAGIGSAFGASNAFNGEIYLRATASAIVGGTASKISGGKFANGAVTAAFQLIVSSAASGGTTDSCKSPCNGEVEVDYSQLKTPEDYKLALDHLNSLNGDSAVNQGSLRTAMFDTAIAGARSNFLQISNIDVANGVFNIRYAQSQQAAGGYVAAVIGGIFALQGGAAARMAWQAMPANRKLMYAEALRRAIGSGVEDALNIDIPGTTGVPKGRIPQVPKRPPYEIHQPY